jgi:hypothetical protein
VAFESGSKLSCIHEPGLSGCSSVKSALVPGCAQRLGGSCFCSCSQLSAVTFESHSKLSGIRARVLRLLVPLRNVHPSVSHIFLVRFVSGNAGACLQRHFNPTRSYPGLRRMRFAIADCSTCFISRYRSNFARASPISSGFLIE